MIKKAASFTKGHSRRIKTKVGGVKIVHVRVHTNRLNTPKRKK